MKNINIIKFLIAGLLGFTSCSIDNVEPSNLLLEDNVISNESTALNVLNRIYNSGLRSNFYGAAGGSGDFVTELSMAGLDTEVLAASLHLLNIITILRRVQMVYFSWFMKLLILTLAIVIILLS